MKCFTLEKIGGQKVTLIELMVTPSVLSKWVLLGLAGSQLHSLRYYAFPVINVLLVNIRGVGYGGADVDSSS